MHLKLQHRRSRNGSPRSLVLGFLLLGLGAGAWAWPVMAIEPAFGGRKIHRDQGDAASRVAKDAGDLYHYGSNLVCSDCHVMHYSQAHGYNADGSGPIAQPGDAGPYGTLLRNNVTDLCLTCHDNHAGIPDVMGADANGLAERSGGFFAPVEQANPRGHDLGRDLPPMDGPQGCFRCHWGSGDQMKVTCVDCHNPHGNGNPRGLQWASDPEGTPPLGLFTAPGATGMSKYERSNNAYGSANSVAMREVTNICIDCHHVFSGDYYTDPNGDGIHQRHPSYDSERLDPNNINQGQDDERTDPAHWAAGTGSGFEGTGRVPFVVSGATNYATASVVDPATNGVFCLSCHKVHGGDYAFGLAWDINNGGVGPRGCDQCHNRAATP